MDDVILLDTPFPDAHYESLVSVESELAQFGFKVTNVYSSVARNELLIVHFLLGRSRVAKGVVRDMQNLFITLLVNVYSQSIKF